jgi:hypothetical protein
VTLEWQSLSGNAQVLVRLFANGKSEDPVGVETPDVRRCIGRWCEYKEVAKYQRK